MWVLVLFPALLGLSSALVCPDGNMCTSWNTCCKNFRGEYACCPLPDAECCSDHIHCCYERTVCDVAHARCVNQTVSLPWMRRLPTQRAPLAPQRLQLQEKPKAVVCPDQESECPDDTTCCQLVDGSWGCCLFAKAVCCEDKRHCCPEGTTCDLEHSKCVSASLGSFPMLKKEPARRRDNNSTLAVGSVSCPGGQGSCPKGTTCCLLIKGLYACCPYPQAICCSDRLHCCPNGTECDMEHDACKPIAPPPPPPQMIAAAARYIVCPDKSACSDHMTCCKMAGGGYDCCPLPNAVCCSDCIHCCPEGRDCDVAHGACIHGRRQMAMNVTLHAAVATLKEGRSEVGVVPCNSSVSCPDGNSCCELPKGGWACCTFPKAVCCKDHMHCCPQGTICNLEAATCDAASGDVSTPWSTKVPAVRSLAANGKCDESTSCPDKSTCCLTKSGGWACCPLPQAVCCDDHLHCCPHATVCNLPAATCDDPTGVSHPVRWLEKTPAVISAAATRKVPARPDRNMCDGQTSCPRDATCCFMDDTRRWGCCPLPKAVCCEDGLHCCPAGHACEPHRAACSKAPHAAVPWLSKLSARSEPAGVTDVKCDDQSSCASGTTCCKLQTGEWGCCPLVKAVCCADREHCCPQGYTCNMQTGTCEKTNDRAALDLPFLQIKVVRPDEEDAPCGVTGEFRCSVRDTCCKVSASEWACCPAPQAVCCPDLKHCCPAGHSCDPAAGGCSQHSQRSQLTWDALTGDRRRDVVPRGL